MTFTHPALLFGLLLAGLPVLLHLLMRQRPKSLPFPAIRFLKLKERTNSRKLRLRHLLLLAMRILLIAFMCLALARPKLFSQRFSLAGDQPVFAVLIIDTTPSMGYVLSGQTRLEHAKQKALELLDDLAANSRVALLTTHEPSTDWLPSITAAREKITELTVQPVAAPLADSLAAGYRLLGETTGNDADNEGEWPRFVYVFSDRTPNCWEQSRTADLLPLIKPLAEKPFRQLFVDVGVDQPINLAVRDTDLKPQAVPSNRPIEIRATITATGQDFDNQVQLRIDGRPEIESQPVKLAAGESQTVTFQRSGLPPGIYQAEISVGTTDPLPIDNVRFVTFEVLEPKRVLIIADAIEDAMPLQRALRRQFALTVWSSSDPKVVDASPADLAKFSAIALVSVSAPGQPVHDLWPKLESYVTQGGSVAVFPGGDELALADYTKAVNLLPAKFVKLVTSPSKTGVNWTDLKTSHPLLAPFREYQQMPDIDFVRTPPAAFRYWEVTPIEAGASVLARYNDAEGRPSLLERDFDRAKVKGRFLLFTTPFDGRVDAQGQPWSDYVSTSFFLTLTNKAMQYLAGETDDVMLNFITGQNIVVPLGTGARFTTFSLRGPELTSTDGTVARPEGQTELRLPQARAAGNYRLTSGNREWSFGFSLNAPPAESELLPRVPADFIAQLMGPDSIVPVSRQTSLKDQLDKQLKQPADLFPWLMLALLFLLTIESFVANRFYKPAPTESP